MMMIIDFAQILYQIATIFLFCLVFIFSSFLSDVTADATAGVETVDLSNNRFDPSLLDGIKHKVKLNLAGCRA